MARPASRRAPMLAVAVASAALLAACSGPPEAVEPTPPAYDVLAIGIDDPAGQEATAPGAALPLGQAAFLPLDGTDPESLTGVSVLDVVEGDPAFWDGFTNASDFAGSLPFYVVYQYQRPSPGGAATSPTVHLIPRDANGADAPTVQTGEADPCPLLLESLDDPDRELGCLVAVTATGGTIASVAWNGTTASTVYAPEPDEDPYFENPVVWTP